MRCVFSKITYHSKAATHVCISHGEARLINSFLKNKVDDPFEAFLSVNLQFRNLLHQLLKHLRRELVEDATDTPEQLLDVAHTTFTYTLGKKSLHATKIKNKEKQKEVHIHLDYALARPPRT